jgi:hypothetical protein
MKKIIVILFFICSAFGQWQQSEEITLPKGIQINDLVISSSGELWVLSTSSVLKYERAAKNPFLISNIDNGKAFTVIDDIIYVIDKNDRLLSISADGEISAISSNIALQSPSWINSAKYNTKAVFFIKEPGRLVVADTKNILGSIATSADLFRTVPDADYAATDIPLFTLANNQIYSWAGGSIKNMQAYQKKVFFSASHEILDFNIVRSGNVFVLFSDSIVALEADGSYKYKVDIDKVYQGSRILTNNAGSSVIVYDHIKKSLKTLSDLGSNQSDEIIVLKNNHPNPVDNYTEIEFSINQFLDLSITVYNLIGEPVKILARGRFPKGNHKVYWHAEDNQGNLVPNGIYFYRLESKKGVAIKQLTVLR